MSSTVYRKRGNKYVKVTRRTPRDIHVRSNSPGIGVFIVLALIIVMGLYALQSNQDIGYSAKDVDGLDKYIEASNKPKTLLQRQAAALQDLFEITDEEVAKPVVLWRD